MNVGIYIYDRAEVLDFSGPFEVFSTASRVCDEAEPFTVFLIGESAGIVHARAGYRVLVDHSINDHPPLDVLIVAGGMHGDAMHKPQVIRWLKRAAEQAQLTASVCTGAFLLAQADVFRNAKVTTHWQDISALRELFPDLTVMEGVRWVDAGNRVSSAGISAGIVCTAPNWPG